MLIKNETKVFSSQTEAEKIAQANNNMDSEWTYTAKPLEHGYAVEVIDEDGVFLGYL